ncbi:MAG TPA: glycosaminoglycan attachment protein [Polyangia bacterium]|nr:glycosaminoglycan attachment protein [Polyangia bacterium]
MKRISRIRFEAFVAYTRHPVSVEFGEEVAWYSDDQERFLGVIVRDLTDDDFGPIVLARDVDGRFRGVDLESSFATQAAAKRRLSELLRAREESGKSVIPQENGKPRRIDLFAPMAPLEELNPRFVSVLREPGYSPALGIMREMAFHFRDPDGNFVQQFQTDGFDARLWELYLFGFLTESGFLLDRSHNSPDFVAVKWDETVCIEAVTVNPTTKSVISPPQDAASFMNDYMPMKFGSPLSSKLKKEYWKLPHVQGHPFVLAIEDFHQEGSMTWTSTALTTYLYGYRHTWKRADDGSLIVIPQQVRVHKVGDKEVPSGFFFQAGTEHVSAVMFSNSATHRQIQQDGVLGWLWFAHPANHPIRHLH